MEGQEGMPVLLLLLLVVGALAAVLFFFLAVDTEKAAYAPLPIEQRGIELSADKEKYLEGELALVSSRDYCGGNFSLAIDGNALAPSKEGDVFKAYVNLSAGSHEITASDGECFARLVVNASARACREGETKGCMTAEGCGGTKWCIHGAFGECSKNQMVCKPGMQIGCTVDNCNSGYKVCNPCGTGYGPCVKE